mmetsp:Transcript_63019/g.136846  ORF Transcript_63019/g.136846 Transcript_63019/m.136846 type:complete len:296 (-) Transcript_63019:787-1674(-)
MRTSLAVLAPRSERSRRGQGCSSCFPLLLLLSRCLIGRLLRGVPALGSGLLSPRSLPADARCRDWRYAHLPQHALPYDEVALLLISRFRRSLRFSLLPPHSSSSGCSRNSLERCLSEADGHRARRSLSLTGLLRHHWRGSSRSRWGLGKPLLCCAGTTLSLRRGVNAHLAGGGPFALSGLGSLALICLAGCPSPSLPGSSLWPRACAARTLLSSSSRLLGFTWSSSCLPLSCCSWQGLDLGLRGTLLVPTLQALGDVRCSDSLLFPLTCTLHGHWHLNSNLGIDLGVEVALCKRL